MTPERKAEIAATAAQARGMDDNDREEIANGASYGPMPWVVRRADNRAALVRAVEDQATEITRLEAENADLRAKVEAVTRLRGTARFDCDDCVRVERFRDALDAALSAKAGDKPDEGAMTAEDRVPQPTDFPAETWKRRKNPLADACFNGTRPRAAADRRDGGAIMREGVYTWAKTIADPKIAHAYDMAYDHRTVCGKEIPRVRGSYDSEGALRCATCGKIVGDR